MTAPKENDNEKLKNLITKNVFFSISSQAFYLSTRLLIPPLTLSMVSLEEYGIWAACFVVIAYLGMGVSGISNTYIRYVGIYHDRGDINSINRLLSTGVTISTCLGLVVLVLMWFAVPGIVSAFNVPEHLHTTGFVLFYGTICIFMVELSWGSFAQVLTGLQRIVEEQMIWIFAFCLEAVMIVSFLFSGFGIYSLLYAFVLRYIFSISATILVCRRLLPGLKIRFRIDRELLKTIIHFGGITQLIGMVNMAMGSIEKVLAGLFLNIRAVGIFDLGQKFPRMAINIPTSLTMAIFPAAAHLDDGARHEELAKLYIKGSRYINLMAGFMTGFLTAFAIEIIGAWLGESQDYHEASLLMMVFALAWQWHTTTGPATAVFKGMGRPLREGVYPLARLVCVVAFTAVSYFVVGGWTVMGIGVAVAASIFFSTTIYMAYANYKLAISQWTFFRRVLLPGLFPYPLAGFMALMSQRMVTAEGRWELVLLVLVAGVTYSLITALLLWFVIIDRDERIYFSGQGRRLLLKLKPGKKGDAAT